MIFENEKICPKCGGELKYYDKVKRIVRTSYGRSYRIDIRRFRCFRCETMHREIPELIFPYKHYEKRIIVGFLSEQLNNDILGFEDYPCDLTIVRWFHSQNLQVVL